MALAKSIGKWEIRPRKMVTPKKFNVKLCIREYVGEITHHASFHFIQYSRGFAPNMRNISDFFDCSVLFFFSESRQQVKPLNRFARFVTHTCFRVRGE